MIAYSGDAGEISRRRVIGPGMQILNWHGISIGAECELLHPELRSTTDSGVSVANSVGLRRLLKSRIVDPYGGRSRPTVAYPSGCSRIRTGVISPVIGSRRSAQTDSVRKSAVTVWAWLEVLARKKISPPSVCRRTKPISGQAAKI